MPIIPEKKMLALSYLAGPTPRPLHYMIQNSEKTMNAAKL